ncbi:interleukin-32 isoform X2 [Callithrix jacchus]|uniref:interleukin-32 n=1 Tax=Callithrix jacchus TaxID=9483 RepID=UPI0004F0220B|nr:interleukin-32 [Callithrix jacchus]XP_035122588.1 interleukin-32 [Callithrix jacchus]
MVSESLSDGMKKLNARMHQLVDKFTEKMGNKESEPEKVKLSLDDLEDDFRECMLDTVVDCYQGQHLELIPLLEKERDELRLRGNRPPALEAEDPETQEPEESFCDKVMRWFCAMMQRLQMWWQKFVAWVKKVVAALVDAAKAFWKELERFCCSLAELLRSLFSTKEAHRGD